MSGLEVALIILILLWTIIFAVIAGAILIIFFAVKRAVDKANKILDETEEVAKRVDLPNKIVIASILGFLAKNTAGGIKNIISEFIKKKK